MQTRCRRDAVVDDVAAQQLPNCKISRNRGYLLQSLPLCTSPWPCRATGPLHPTHPLQILSGAMCGGLLCQWTACITKPQRTEAQASILAILAGVRHHVTFPSSSRVPLTSKADILNAQSWRALRCICQLPMAVPGIERLAAALHLAAAHTAHWVRHAWQELGQICLHHMCDAAFWCLWCKVMAVTMCTEHAQFVVDHKHNGCMQVVRHPGESSCRAMLLHL